MGIRLVIGAVALALCGCITTPPSEGELGRAEFAWDEGLLGCLFGCDARSPMAAGAHAYLEVVNHEELPAFTVSSEDTAVIAFTLELAGEGSVDCQALQAGSARVLLNDATTGKEIDRFKITAEDVVDITTSPDLYVATFTIMEGGETQIPLTLTGTSGRELVGIGGVDYAFAGGISEDQATLGSAIGDAIGEVLVGNNSEYVRVETHALGTGQLTAAAASGTTLTIPFAIVDAAAVTALTLEARGELEAGSAIIVDALAEAGVEPLHSPLCEWSLSPPEGPLLIDYTGRDYAQVKATATGTATLTCVVGAQTAAIEMKAVAPSR